MPWHARLSLDYTLEAGRTVARFAHSGPLRILQSLYPEGDAICHNVMVHPPSGLVGGDLLDIAVTAGEGAHGVITTPGASRFYRSDGETAAQHTHIALGAGARIEWLPLEAICYSGCIAENRLTLDIAPGAELMGWDVTALGLPLADQPFVRGTFQQHIELPGAWLERGRVAANDARLLDGPLGLAGHRCMATLFLACGTPLDRARRERALELAREVIDAHPIAGLGGDAGLAGATSPSPQVVAVRAVAPLVEPAMALLRDVRAAWRTGLWDLPATVPRTWAL
ncbi:MAG: urease accessory protein UreD [Proteobacteria bacterium]|jgi:urease accessory protein|nr:urease accessory protein UreD [Pseudomonadota bacterium]